MCEKKDFPFLSATATTTTVWSARAAAATTPSTSAARTRSTAPSTRTAARTLKFTQKYSNKKLWHSDVSFAFNPSIVQPRFTPHVHKPRELHAQRERERERERRKRNTLNCHARLKNEKISTVHRAKQINYSGTPLDLPHFHDCALVPRSKKTISSPPPR